jgi:hypothetical protein
VERVFSLERVGERMDGIYRRLWRHDEEAGAA